MSPVLTVYCCWERDQLRQHSAEFLPWSPLLQLRLHPPEEYPAYGARQLGSGCECLQRIQPPELREPRLGHQQRSVRNDPLHSGSADQPVRCVRRIGSVRKATAGTGAADVLAESYSSLQGGLEKGPPFCSCGGCVDSGATMCIVAGSECRGECHAREEGDHRG